VQKQGIWLRDMGSAAVLVTQGKHLLLDAEARGLVTSWWHQCGGQVPPREWVCSELQKRLKRPASDRELARAANLLMEVARLLSSIPAEKSHVKHRPAPRPYHLGRLDVRLEGSQRPAIGEWLDALAKLFSYRIVLRVDVDAANIGDGVACVAGAANWFARQGKLFLPHCIVHVRADSPTETAAITRCFQAVELHGVLTSLVISVKRGIKGLKAEAHWAGNSLCVLPSLEVTSCSASEVRQFVAASDHCPLLLVDGDPPASPWQYREIAAIADPVQQVVFFLDDCRNQLLLWDLRECPGGKTVLAVDDLGSLFPCLHMLRRQQWCLGNVLAEERTYWCQVEDLETQRRQDQPARCETCPAQGWCSRCPAHDPWEAEAICAMKAAMWEQLT
jgi:radical SAM protein with 4Fe4S-binding SPASM domain